MNLSEIIERVEGATGPDRELDTGGGSPKGRERPILFSAPMVNAILAGRKVQTRRAVKPQPHHGPVGEMVHIGDGEWAMDDGDLSGLWRCPYGVPGDQLWVRESGELLRHAYDHDPRVGRDVWESVGWVHAADGAVVAREAHDPPLVEWIDDCGRHPKPSIHMPRWASRIVLEVVEIRVERLQDISEEDADAEGFGGDFPDNVMPEVFPRREGGWGHLSIPECYGRLWEHINGPNCWAANPWVWAVSFRPLAGITAPSSSDGEGAQHVGEANGKPAEPNPEGAQ